LNQFLSPHYDFSHKFLDEEGRIYGIEIVGVSERMPVASLGKINKDVPVAGVPA